MYASKVMGIEPDIFEVVFAHESQMPNKEVFATSDRKTYVIYFNSEMVEERDYQEITITAFHETRHLYQVMVVEFSSKMNLTSYEKKILKDWKRCLQNPVIPEGNEKEDTEYLNQSTEIDAIAFTYYLMNKLTNVKPIIPESIKEKVLIVANELQKQYN